MHHSEEKFIEHIHSNLELSGWYVVSGYFSQVTDDFFV